MTFTQGQRVRTPLGLGSVAYQRLSPPAYIAAEVVSVVLDGKRAQPGYAGTILPADDVQPIVHAFSQGRMATALCGASNADDGDAPATEDPAEVTCPDCLARRAAAVARHQRADPHCTCGDCILAHARQLLILPLVRVSTAATTAGEADDRITTAEAWAKRYTRGGVRGEVDRG